MKKKAGRPKKDPAAKKEKVYARLYDADLSFIKARGHTLQTYLDEKIRLDRENNS